LTQVVVLPLLLQLLLHLVEDLTALLGFERIDPLKRLAHEADQRVVEAAPLHVDVVAGQLDVERKFGTLCHV